MRLINILATALGLVAALPAYAHDADHPYDADSDRARWFKTLTVPGSTTAICCNIADGHQVEAKYEGHTWYAKWQGVWVSIPPNIVLKESSIDEDAYLFVYYGALRCFVPPDHGS
jgi:hypothetical protein